MSNIIVMAFSPRNIVGCLLKKGLQRGGGGLRAPQDPPCYALEWRPDSRKQQKSSPSLIPLFNTITLAKFCNFIYWLILCSTFSLRRSWKFFMIMNFTIHPVKYYLLHCMCALCAFPLIRSWKFFMYFTIHPVKYYLL